MSFRGVQGAMSIKRRRDSAKKAQEIRNFSPSRRQSVKPESNTIQMDSEKSKPIDDLGDLIFFNTIDKLIKLQVSEWKLHYDMLSKAGNKYVSIDEFALGHGKVMSVIGKRFFDGSKKINFNQYCCYMMLVAAHGDCHGVNEKRIQDAYDDYCAIRKPQPNGLIKSSDFAEKNPEFLTNYQIEAILGPMSKALSCDFYPGEINYLQFKEIVESILAFSLMDRNHDSTLSRKEIKIFLKLMGKHNRSEDEVRKFFDSHDVNDDGEVSLYEFLSTKY